MQLSEHHLVIEPSHQLYLEDERVLILVAFVGWNQLNQNHLTHPMIPLLLHPHSTRFRNLLLRLMTDQMHCSNPHHCLKPSIPLFFALLWFRRIEGIFFSVDVVLCLSKDFFLSFFFAER